MAAICARLPCRLKLRLGLWLVHHWLVDARLLDLGAPLGVPVGHLFDFRVDCADRVLDLGHVVQEPFPFRADRFGGRGVFGFALGIRFGLALLVGSGVPGRNRLSRSFGFRLGLGFRRGLGLCCLGSRPGFRVGDHPVKPGVELRVGLYLPFLRGPASLGYPVGLVPAPELGLGFPGCLGLPGVGFRPFPAGSVGYSEPGEVLGGIAGPRFRLRCRLGVHGIPGRVSAGLGVLPVTLALADLRLDISRRNRHSPVVRGYPRLELAASHGPQQGLIVGQLQGNDRGVEGLP